MDIPTLLGRKPKKKGSSSSRPTSRPRQSLPVDYGLNIPPLFPPGSMAPRPPLFPNPVPPNLGSANKLKTTYLCDFCGRQFAQRSDRDKHKRTVHLKEKRHMCPICGTSFGEKGNLNKHLKAKHDRQRQKEYKCPHCHKGFPFKDGRDRHIRQVHMEERKFMCKYCGYAFKQKAHCKKHETTIHESQKSKAGKRCEFCGQMLRERHDMKKHLREVHGFRI